MCNGRLAAIRGRVVNTNLNLFHATYRTLPNVTASLHGYFVEVDDDASLSSRSFGARILGAHSLDKDLRVTYLGEFARHNEFRNNPASFSLDSCRVEPGVKLGDAAASIGIEVLEGNGAASVQTPFATLHKFQGFADVFTTTPALGIEDRFIAFEYKRTRVASFDSVRVWGAYHAFTSNRSSTDYGSEIDATIALSFLQRYRVTLKYANYDANRFAADTERFWVFFEFRT